MRTSEMLLASAEVIAHRTARMSTAGIQPDPHDSAEFTLMGQEKVDAALECAGALARHATQGSWTQATRAWQDAWRLGLDVTRLAGSLTPTQALAHHAQLMRGLARTSRRANHATSSALALSDRVLDPLHRRTAANVKRLRRAAR